MSFQHFDIARLPSEPWKNGGGSTRELVRQPAAASLDDFDWRVSIASIAAGGPFSAFPGVDRLIMLLRGAGVHLHAAGLDHRLDAVLEPYAFAGDVQLECKLLGGTCTDFNVMTRRGKLRAEVQVLKASGEIAAADGGLLLAVRDTWQLRADAVVEPLLAGQGIWWNGARQGWQALTHSSGAALAVVRIEPGQTL